MSNEKIELITESNLEIDDFIEPIFSKDFTVNDLEKYLEETPNYFLSLDKEGTPLVHKFCASENFTPKMFETFLKLKPEFLIIQDEEQSLNTPLHNICELETFDLEMLTMVLQMLAKYPEVKNAYDETPLHTLNTKKWTAEMFEFILTNNADCLIDKSECDATPLHFFARSCTEINILKIILEHEKEEYLHVKQSFGTTVLEDLFQCSNITSESIECLLKEKAEYFDFVGSNENTAVHCLVESPYFTLKMLELLLEYKQNIFISSINENQETPLENLCSFGLFTPAMAELLLNKKLLNTDHFHSIFCRKDNLKVSALLMVHGHFPKSSNQSVQDEVYILASSFRRKSHKEVFQTLYPSVTEESSVTPLTPNKAGARSRDFFIKNCKHFSKDSKDKIFTALCALSVFRKQAKLVVPKPIIENIISQISDDSEWLKAISNRLTRN